MDHAAITQPDTAEAFDVDARVAQRLADVGQPAGSILDGHTQIRRHRCPLPPRWSLGVRLGREPVKSRARVRADAVDPAADLVPRRPTGRQAALSPDAVRRRFLLGAGSGHRPRRVRDLRPRRRDLDVEDQRRRRILTRDRPRRTGPWLRRTRRRPPGGSFDRANPAPRSVGVSSGIAVASHPSVQDERRALLARLALGDRLQGRPWGRAGDRAATVPSVPRHAVPNPVRLSSFMKWSSG